MSASRPTRSQASIVAHSGDFSITGVVLPVLPDITVTSIAFEDRHSMLPIEGASLDGVRSSPFDAFYYGGVSTPTTEALCQAVARLEGGVGAVLTPSGQAAIALLILDNLASGDHVLVSSGLTYTTQWLFDDLARTLGFTVAQFDASDILQLDMLVRPTTRMIFAEVPTSVVFEILDIGSIVSVGRSKGIPVVLDTTWSASHYLQAFSVGADATVLSLTKMHAGVQGVSLGAVVVKDVQQLGRLRNRAAMLGLHVAPGTCARASTAIVTLSARLAFQTTSLERVIDSIRDHPAVEKLYHPSQSDSKNQTLWRRYFTGAAPLISIRLRPNDLATIDGSIDRMRLIKRGYGWGGATSLCQAIQPSDPAHSGWLLRIYLGLEHPDDLLQDLTQALG
jgi:cysteine-S-conjugate beta-lyase